MAAPIDLEKSLEKMKQLGYRLTPQRIELLQALIDDKRPMSAHEIHEKVKQSHPHVSLDTVYRNLSTLASTGIISQINLQSRDSAKFEFQGASHHHHAVCIDCKTSICLDTCGLPERTMQEVQKTGFSIVGHVFEIYGYCENCKTSSTQ